MRYRDLRRDVAVALLFLACALLFFGPVTLEGKTLLPADNAFEWEPWKSYAQQVGIETPHNSLISDLYIQNYVWKRFVVESIRNRQLPLWNPYILGGIPFLAAGQHSALYPPSALFYVLPLPAAYGWFAALHLFLAGLFTYILARTLGLRRVASALAGVTFMLSGFVFISNVFPMIMASLVWLPLILVCIERIARRAEQADANPFCHIPDALLGAMAFGMLFLAGHPEMYYYVSLTAGAFALWRLAGLGLRKNWAGALKAGALLLAMVALGAGLGAAQWIPLLQLVRENFREGAATLQDVLGWAYPKRRIISLLIPDFFGNPAHHSYFDLFTWRQQPVMVNALGQQIRTIYWGIKNYVEGASYLGTMPFVLALVGALRQKGRHAAFFSLLALVSLLFVFGSPLYALVFKLPGLSQVHSPFRWIYPYSLCMAILAGMGLQALWDGAQRREGCLLGRAVQWLAERALPWGTLLGGAGLLAALGASLLVKERMASLAEQVMRRLALAPEAFADGRMFYSYQFRNLLVFALALCAGGLALALGRRQRRASIVGAALILITVAELYVIGHAFFPANDPSLVEYRTPAIDFLQSDPELYRITSYVGGSEKPFNANVGMLYGIGDVRGYDSIIPQQYVQYMSLIQEQSELPYNRIAPLFDHSPQALDSPLLDLLNVKYVLTTPQRTIHNEGYTLVYDQELRIYRNESALPRAFLVPRAEYIADPQERNRALQTRDPHQAVILDEPVPAGLDRPAPASFSAAVESIYYTPNEVTITYDSPVDCWLVLADNFWHGWQAFVREPDDTDGQQEQRLHIYRAYNNLRAVPVPAGRHVVRFKYSPNAIKYGLYGSFMAGVIALLAGALWIWGRGRRSAAQAGDVQRITKNTVTPMALSLLNKGIDMVFAMLMLRILGPADAGAYSMAIVVIAWFDIFTNFGLNTLQTREVAKDRSLANRYLSNTTVLRLVLCLLSVPILGAFFLLRRFTKPLDPDSIRAILLFAVALLPSNVSTSLSAMFNAYERMEIPASVTTLTTVLKVTLGAAALVAGTGYVGLAAVSILVNVVTLTILYRILRKTLFRPRLELDWALQKAMLIASYPLMINHLLATLFFKIAVLLLEWFAHDPREVGWFTTAYKYIDAVGIIPAYFTLAIFPLMSRYAATAKGSLYKAYQLAIKLLLIVAMPVAFFTWALSKPLIMLLGGSQYLPYSAYVLQVVIWYMPFGFINSVTQYVLIALDQQRFLTRAFAIGLAFNVAANVLLIPRFGYMASAYVAVLSEVVLLIPFLVGIRKHLAHIPLLKLGWMPLVCSAPLGALLYLLPSRYIPLSMVLGSAIYLAGLYGLRVFDAEERQVVAQVVPLGRLKDRLARMWTRLSPQSSKSP